MIRLDATHDPALKSWVASANAPECDFPIQNLPFGIFRPRGSKEKGRPGVAIGDRIADLRALRRRVGAIRIGFGECAGRVEPARRH